MQYVTIGTAGHVDHGKTCLVKALTGVDTDRLLEEKQRGLTLDLGFAPIDLGKEIQGGIIDVPGHERFIKNMLAGVCGMEIIILVIAADEGIMPQTVEHLQILSLMGIKKGLIALTRCDLADIMQKQKVKQDIKVLVQGTFLEQAQVIETSILTGEGIHAIQRELAYLARTLPPKDLSLPFILPIDRVFTVSGFGTVITGTLVQGRIHAGAKGILYPKGKEVRIRRLEIFGKKSEWVQAGARVAVNLPGAEKKQISRGMVLAQPGSQKTADRVDIQFQTVKNLKEPVKNNSRIQVCWGAGAFHGRLLLKDKEQILPGEKCQAQLRLEKELYIKPGDHLILRKYSPAETIGGGVVTQLCEKRRREKIFQKPKQSSETMEKIRALYQEAGFFPPKTCEVKKQLGKEQGFSTEFLKMIQQGELCRFGNGDYMARTFYMKGKECAAALFGKQGEIPTGIFRDTLEISRKCAITLLGSYDREHFTIWDGKKRILAHKWEENK
nr:selenocysteine-specific translation elongation factor [uncultured Blautia sp.]